jgi:hypothetical protein
MFIGPAHPDFPVGICKPDHHLVGEGPLDGLDLFLVDNGTSVDPPELVRIQPVRQLFMAVLIRYSREAV